MGRFGAAYGIPFAVEGLFFFVEAIFVAVYIYGWDRMRPWAHFWSGVPVPLAGIGGTLSVVAANGWMNRPAPELGGYAALRPLRIGRCTDLGILSSSGAFGCAVIGRGHSRPAKLRIQGRQVRGAAAIVAGITDPLGALVTQVWREKR